VHKFFAFSAKFFCAVGKKFANFFMLNSLISVAAADAVAAEGWGCEKSETLTK
jgi:hypothetical protein